MHFRLSSIRRRLSSTSLTQRFVFTTAIILIIFTIIVGSWISRKILDAVLIRNSETAALYMESFLEPLVQDLEAGPTLSPESIAGLQALAQKGILRRHVYLIKVWHPNGTVVFSSNAAIIGQTFDPAEIAEALKGNITAYREILGDEGDAGSQTFQTPIYEVYVPLRSQMTNSIIAVGEFYEDASVIEKTLAQAVRESWLVVGGTGAGALLILYLIVNSGTIVIATQKSELTHLDDERSKLEQDNHDLAQQIRVAHSVLADLDEKLKRRIGLELHDGPTQLISFILMHLDDIQRLTEKSDGTASNELLSELRSAAEDALLDIRDISNDLVRGPNDKPLRQSLSLDARIAAHERRTGLQVDKKGLECLRGLPDSLEQAVIQVVREALTNGHKHARGSTQSVTAWLEDGDLCLEIADEGQALELATPHPLPGGGGLGVAGMRYRAEAIDGSMVVLHKQGCGTTVSFRFPLSNDAPDNKA